MSELKCPFCQQEIKIAGEHTTIMSCFNGDCKGSGLYGEEAFWQELIRTCKALDKAIWWLNEIVENHRCTPISTAEMALAEIKRITKTKDNK